MGGAVRGYLELLRPVNSVAAALLTLIGGFIAAGVTANQWHLGAAVLSTVFATGAGNTINDYFDRDIDRINDPERPIPRGDVHPKGALIWSAGLFAGAIVLAITLPPVAILIAILNFMGLVSYTILFKGHPGAGNALVAYLGGSTFLFGAAAVGAVWDGAVLFALAALSTFAREVIKDIEDIAGDRSEGLTTLPIAFGSGPAFGVASVALIGAVVASPIPYLTELFGLPYLAVVGPADFLMLVALFKSRSDPGTGHKWLKYGMFLAAVAFIVGRLSIVLT
ncbi:geranylgeranylglycerol-phosphate geranylgeranyltransferase [Halodesulfurarchaeum sp.]|uniref:geranylgeranylglycerol-phosphate geranylgeranyltransferase n=1 Tax=Halodesulfurarchaeum sp. TaxID=1980530 RepID=UPI002FC29656